jgi:transcriptional regulator with XRE-family HTH domain
MGILSEEIGTVLYRNRRAFRFTQSDLGRRIGVSGSYISSLENGKASPRVSELEELAAHFRTTALELLQEAARADEGFIPAEPRGKPDTGLDEVAADLSDAHRELARAFLVFLREREREDAAMRKAAP